MSEAILKKLTQPNYLTAELPNIYSYLNSTLKDIVVDYYPYMSDVKNMSRDIIECTDNIDVWYGVRCYWSAPATLCVAPARRARDSANKPYAKAVLLAVDKAIALEVLEKETSYTHLPQQQEDAASKGENDPYTGMEHLNTKLLSLLYSKDHRNIKSSAIPDPHEHKPDTVTDFIE